MALDHAKVLDSLRQLPLLTGAVTDDWLDQQRRRPELVDAHLVYRLLAAGPVGWAQDQLAQLESLMQRLRHNEWLEDKVRDLLAGNQDRVDSVAGELLLADYLQRSGHRLRADPDQGGRRPEFLVDDRALVEMKTFCPPVDPHARLRSLICENIDSGFSVSLHVSGELLSNDVAPLARQLASTLPWSRGVCMDARHGAAVAQLVAEYKVEGLEGTAIVGGDHRAAADVSDAPAFWSWLENRVKKARGQTAGFSGRRVLVLDVSHCREIADLHHLRPRHVADAVDAEVTRLSAGRLRGAVTQRAGFFGQLVFMPPDTFERALTAGPPIAL
jgi:hypothetical protein